MQSLPHLMPAGELVTVPEPAPALVTVRTNPLLPPVVNVAVTDLASVIETTQLPVPVQAPDQPPKVEPRLALAVRVTVVPLVYVWVQSLPHLIPVGALVTVPEPVPVFETVKLNGPSRRQHQRNRGRQRCSRSRSWSPRLRPPLRTKLAVAAPRSSKSRICRRACSRK